MKIIVTGSLGHISKPLAQTLVQQGHDVTVISSKAERQQEIEAIGAKAAIGSMEDADFLSTAFAGADSVYCMFTAGGFFNPHFDIMEHIASIARNYKQAIMNAGVKHAIHLSSIGAHTDVGNGLLAFHHRAENVLKELPEDVALTTLRPVGFYYNLLSFIPGIKANGVIATNYGGDKPKPWVSVKDIAAVAAEEIGKPFTGRKVRYIASDEISCDEIATILGTAIGKPDLKWMVVPDEQVLAGMKAMGMNAQIAEGLVTMNAAILEGSLYEDYYRNRPVLSNTKIVDYAPEFAAAYNQ